MATKMTRTLPARLERLRRRFEHWRGTHRARLRIPEPLWVSAVKMAGMYGLNRTARTLRLDYYVLKKRVQQTGTPMAGQAETGPATFFELANPLPTGACECSLELENAAGAKMRVHLKGVVSPDLAALSRNFWNQQS
jgi:hypothetical protein